MMDQAQRVLHIITDLNTGGAETMLYKLMSRIDRSQFDTQVVSLTDKGSIAEEIEALGFTVQALGMRRGVPDPRGIWRLGKLVRNLRPQVIQTWMYHSDLIGGLAAKWAGKIPVIWNIRHSNLYPNENKKTTRWTAKACAVLSKSIPRRIICCSEASRQVHSEIGYAQEKMVVIPNGFDLNAFYPDEKARESLRNELGVAQGTVVLGMVARFNPQKDHKNLVQAASILKKQGIDFIFVLCGKDIDQKNAQLNNWIQEADLWDRFFLLGPRDDMPRITAGLDIGVLSSAHGEGFPNVLGEAMACKVPCVATDVGDSAEIIGNTGFVVPPRDPEALAHALKRMLELGSDGRAELGKVARERVEKRFELGSVVKQYKALYRDVLEEE